MESLARSLRPLLPPEAFRSDPGRLGLLLINLAILGLGWTMARQLEQWSWAALPLFLPFSLVMGNAVIVLLFASHDLLHGSAVRGAGWRRAVGLLGLALLWDASHPVAGGAQPGAPRPHQQPAGSGSQLPGAATGELGQVDPAPLHPL